MFTFDDLKDIYKSLYYTNEEAAEEDYMEYFQTEYSPALLDGCSSEEDVRKQIARLTEEILNDTGDEDLTRRWLIEAGADDILVADCGL